MALYTGYFDDSGHEYADMLLLGGLVIDVETVREFDAAWLAAIAPLARLHMKVFVTETKNIPDERNPIIQRVACVIDKFAFQTFSSAIWMEDYLKADAELKISETVGRPFAVCARLADVQLNQWARRHGVTDRVKIVFERRPEGVGDTDDLFNRDELPIPGWEGKEVCALQTADYIAWLHNAKIRKSDNYKRFAVGEPPKVLHTHDWFGYRDIMGIAGRVATVAAQPIPLRSEDTVVVYHNKENRPRVPFKRKRK